MAADGAQFEGAVPDVSSRAQKTEATLALGGRGAKGHPRRPVDDSGGIDRALAGHDPYRAVWL